MANSLSDQLLKAGLITQDQIEKADQDKQKQKEKARAKFKKKADGHPNRTKNKPEAQKPNKKPQKQSSDLAKFYQQRNQAEQAERAAEEKRKRETAERRRKTRKQVRELINANIKNQDDATIRYNFVVGETVKYLFVTEDQQKLIASGELSITFVDGKRCLIPAEIGEQILALDPEKVVIRFTEAEAAAEANDEAETMYRALAEAEKAEAEAAKKAEEAKAAAETAANAEGNAANDSTSATAESDKTEAVAVEANKADKAKAQG